MIAEFFSALALASSHASVGNPPAGAWLGQLSIPHIHLTAMVEQGGEDMFTDPWPVELNGGPALYPHSSLPWQVGTVAMAGHRTTFTHPFRELNLLRKGDAIILKTQRGIYHYKVFAMKIVSPQSLWVLGKIRGHRLVLTACHPPHLAIKRLVVFARLVSVQHRS